jgi:mRNA interferase RelE/StbE
MQYELIIKPSAERSLDRLPRPVRERIVNSMRKLRNEPRPAAALKLQGEDNLYRLRVGSYRVVYEIHDNVLLVLVLRVAHRKDVYRGG